MRPSAIFLRSSSATLRDGAAALRSAPLRIELRGGASHVPPHAAPLRLMAARRSVPRGGIVHRSCDAAAHERAPSATAALSEHVPPAPSQLGVSH